MRAICKKDIEVEGYTYRQGVEYDIISTHIESVKLENSDPVGISRSLFTEHFEIVSNSSTLGSPDSEVAAIKMRSPQPHYDNTNGSLYKIAQELGMNHWEFDIFKRITRCRKKGQFKQDLQKIKDTIDIYLNEYKPE